MGESLQTIQYWPIIYIAILSAKLLAKYTFTLKTPSYRDANIAIKIGIRTTLFFSVAGYCVGM